MPTYDYYSEETGETREVFHNMSENPEILDSQGNVMKRVVSGGLGFTIKTGGTRRRSWAQRHGHKVTSNNPTPTESAQSKAKAAEQESSQKSNDPYASFRQ